VRKCHKVDFDLEGHINTMQEVNEVSKQVVKMAIDGEITCEEAEECGRILEQRMKVLTDTEVMGKIDATCQKVDMIMIKNGR
jgi:hypothetical protein